MKLKCNQMEILTSFYLENELSPCLKEQFEEHLINCVTCSAKFEVIKSIFKEMQNEVDLKYTNNNQYVDYSTDVHKNILHDKLSEYVDNELQDEENIKIKKIAITNKDVRKELEDSYNIRRIMGDSFKKSKTDAKQDYTKNILKQLEIEETVESEFNPFVRVFIIFSISTLILIVVTFILINY